MIVSDFKYKSESLLNYYRREAAARPEQWQAALHIARNWHELVERTNVTAAEKRKFVDEVESLEEDLGSAWSELNYWIRKWAERS